MVRRLEAADMLYGPDEVLALRESVIAIRDEFLRGGKFAEAVSLSHVIALMAVFAADMKAPRA